MLKRVAALCAVGFALPAVLLQAQDLFVLPGSGATNGEVQAFVTNPLTTFTTLDAGTGAFALLPNSAVSKFFIVASSNTNSVIATDRTFLAPAFVANLPAPATSALITPDGKLLAVAAGTVHLFNTTTNQELFAGGISQGNGINTYAIAASLDSSTIFALGSGGNGTSQLTAINTTYYGATASLSLPSVATGVSVGPNGLVYVSLVNQIMEVDPRTLQTTYSGAIGVSGTPGPLVFTPDGLYGVAVNQALTGNNLVIASLATHTATSPALGLPQLTSLLVTGVDTVLALSGQGLYEVQISSLPTATQIQPAGVSPMALRALAATNDIPAGSHTTVQAAWVASATNINQFDPATQSFVAQYPIGANITPGVLTYAVPSLTNATSTPATLLKYGANQTILPDTISEPLVVKVLDSNNLPISGYTVQFQTNSASVAVSPTSAVTGTNGDALTYVTTSAATGSFAVTATVGSLTATFPISVATTAHGGGGPLLTIVAGQGQLMSEETGTAAGPAYGSPLEVLATDAGGNPIANLPVTFAVSATAGTLVVGSNGADTQTVNTNSDGVASVNFFTTLVPANDLEDYLQSLVTASALNTNIVTFYITTVQNPYLYLLAPQQAAVLTGPEGGTLPGAVQVRVVSPSGFPIPNVSLSINDSTPNPLLQPTIACNAPGGVVLTNSQGIASCDATFGPRLGSGTFLAVIGTTRSSIAPIPFIVTAGAPATVQITQGNNQTGVPGQALPLALRIRVTDSGGNVVAGAHVNWQVLTAGTVTLSNVISTTDGSGSASALATLGSTGGIAQVTSTAGTVSVTFSLIVNIPTRGLQKVSGDQQTTTAGLPFALPVVVKVVDTNGNGIPGTQVNFQVTAGVATLGSSSAITDSTGQASTTVTAGPTAGAITVSATSSSFSVNFTLTALPVGPSGITIVNGASFDPNTGISPGGIATIRGTGILSGVQGVVLATNSDGSLPTTFSGVTITFNGTPAPIFYVYHANGVDQISVQVPVEVQPGPSVALQISVASEAPVTIQVPVKPLAPGIFTTSYGGKSYAAAVRPNGSPVSPTNPAQRGENIQLYVTGLGQATPAITTGAVGVPNQAIVSPLLVGLNNGGVPLIGAVYGPGLIGVYVVTIQVPENTQTGEYQPIGLIAYDSANNAYFAQPTYIPIQ